ncbi:MAG TPA: hypothetical protein PK040_07945 [Anaerolineaceae bacterium]|nr:hypothetical protein [Anaerolineaceae bacterium]
MKKIMLLAVTLLMVFALAACNLPIGQTGNNESAVQTQVALNVALTQVAGTITALVPADTQTPQPTVEIPPTLTPTITLTLEPSFTATLAGVWLTLQENTNCRIGQGEPFNIVTTVKEGNMVEAVARNPNNDYFYIKNPNSASGFCWMWGRFATLTGNITSLPVFTPMPTPTQATPTPAADFDVSFNGMTTCGGDYAVTVKISNVGTLTWQSIRIVLKDRTTDTTREHTADVFKAYSGCDAGVSQDDLTPGESGLVTTVPGYFNYNLNGHDLKITVTLYSKNGLSGTSVSKSFNVTP